ncbi:MAG: FUSC family protein [Synechococcaceae cyanobacterium]|nr:FUSC family protein [Synechococcaceae cyanobacterium]
MNHQLLRYSLRLGVAATLTAAIAVWTERIDYVWYPLLAVVMIVDDNDDQTLKAASGRVLGTILGGLVTFLVHTLLGGWIGVLVSLLLMLPLLRLLGWQSAIGSATLVSVMFLMIPGHAALDWDYVFNRGLDTAVGCLVAVGVGLLFWPRNALDMLHEESLLLRRRLQQQLGLYNTWLTAGRERPPALPAAPFTAGLQRLESLVALEERGPRRRRLRRLAWPERLRTWQAIEHHWVALERLLALLPPQLPATGGGATAPLPAAIAALAEPLSPGSPSIPAAEAPPPPSSAMPATALPAQAPPPPLPSGAPPAPEGAAADGQESLRSWQRQAQASGLPLLLLLAIASEQRQLLAALQQLERLERC